MEAFDSAEARREAIDRIVGRWQRAVPTGARRLERVGDVRLLAGTELEIFPLPVFEIAAAAIEI
jgi:hypothetical protein